MAASVSARTALQGGPGELDTGGCWGTDDSTRAHGWLKNGQLWLRLSTAAGARCRGAGMSMPGGTARVGELLSGLFPLFFGSYPGSMRFILAGATNPGELSFDLRIYPSVTVFCCCGLWRRGGGAAAAAAARARRWL